MDIPLQDPDCYMALHEKVALEGLLAHIKPTVAIELGTYLGGSLKRMAEWSGHVHSFDLTLKVDPADYPNVTFHIGDSHQLLPVLLSKLAGREESVQFVLVDGDHSPEGARRDLMDLLESPVLTDCAIVLHDMANEAVRNGVESVPYENFSKVAWADLDFIPSKKRAHGLTEGWSGLGLIVIDGDRAGPGAGPPRRAPSADRLRRLRDLRRRVRHRSGIALRAVTPFRRR
jgi:methyltransferase family protein